MNTRVAPQPPRRHASNGAVLARGVFFNAIAFLASNLRGIFMFLVARLLGSVILGTFGLAWASMDLLSKFGTLGFDYTGITFVAVAEAAGDRARSRQVLRIVLSISVVSSVVLAACGCWLTWNLGPRFGLRPELARAIAIMFLAIPGVALYRISTALSRGMGVMHHDIFSRGLTESLGTAAALLIAFSLGLRQLAPEVAAIAGTLASGLVAFVLARRLFFRSEARATCTSDEKLMPELLRASAPIALYDLLNIGIMHIDVLMLGSFVGRAPGVTLETLGIYAAGVQLVGGLRKVNQAFTPIFTPTIARQISAGRLREAEETYGYLARWMLALLLPATVVLALAAGAIMTVFGAGFSRGGHWAAVVGAACAMNAFVGLGETILMVERPQINLINSSVAFAAAVGLNLLLIPKFGPLGAALGMLVPYSLKGVLRAVQIWWLLQWRWPWRALLKPWAAALMPLPLVLLLRWNITGRAWEIVSALLYLGGYVLAWKLIRLDQRDRAVLDLLFRRKEAALTTAD
ncbi:MAG: oligosaccharide flippase family protein [Verrucomicrobiota bacterium]|nr:oligosaccharide flippase family protein [Verrucomicrobiota bacterium]